MIKKTIIVLLALSIIGGILFTIGSVISDDEISNIKNKSSSKLVIENDNTEDQRSEVDTTGDQSSIDAFTDININVMSADIYLIYGDEYALEYNIHDREKVKISDVSKGVLSFETTFNLDFKVDYGDWYVKVTVPKDSEIGDLNLSTAAGDILIEDAVLKNAKLNSTSGKVTVVNSKMDTVEIKTVSGEISIKDSEILTVKAKNKAENILLTGIFSDVDINSIAGNISINGTISDGVKIESISGNIDMISTKPMKLLAESIGKIEYNNKNQGYKFDNSQGDANFHLKSVSGKVKINDK